MSDLRHYKPNELEMALKIALKVIDHLLAEKPKGGLVVNKGQDIEAKMSYRKAKQCIKRIQRRFGSLGAFSFGICGDCTKWDISGHCTGDYEDFGTCKSTKKYTHRYDCCNNHSIENGGWGL